MRGRLDRKSKRPRRKHDAHPARLFADSCAGRDSLRAGCCSSHAQGRPEFADIEELTNNQNERFLFSTQYLTRRYAKAISDVDEFCD